jgi:predicted TIM-barrel fold metal-dependent hydrolase
MGLLGEDISDHRAVLAKLDEWNEEPEVLGVRISLRGDGTWHLICDSIWQALVDRHLPVMIFAPGLDDHLLEVAREYSELRIAIDHLGVPVTDLRTNLDGAVHSMMRFAAYPNVAVKTSALHSVTTERWPFTKLGQAISHLVEAFGSERVFWGSDLARSPYDYAQIVQFFASLELREEDVENLMGSAVARWINWRLDP